MTSTIFALSSGSLPSAIAVVRISGPAAFDAVAMLAGDVPPVRRASLRTLRYQDRHLDRALVLTFPGPTTATGENLVELHLHGGRAVVRAVEAALGQVEGLRPALPGEFTRRALTNGRIDLTEAEGLADLLAAETETQRVAALRLAEGELRRRIEGWSARVLDLSAGVEALLDHGDEADVAAESDTLGIVGANAGELANEIDSFVDCPTVERLHDGLRVVLAGPPNAGKSTLLNRLAGRDAAIVSPLAGTTRDVIEVPVMRAGIAWLLTDTAGLHDAPSDIVEEIGIDLAHKSLEKADLILWLDDAPPPTAVSSRSHLLIHPRADLEDRCTVPAGRMPVSANSVSDVAALWSLIEERTAGLLPASDSVPLNQRQRDLAAAAAAALHQAELAHDPLILAEDLRLALAAFDAITGKSDVEAMLDTLFGRFCIGK